MTETPPPDAAVTIAPLLELMRPRVGESLDEADRLGAIVGRLLDLADPRGTPEVPDHVRAQLRELAGQLAVIEEAVTDRLSTVADVIEGALIRSVRPDAP